jgi:hypothetical protein
LLESCDVDTTWSCGAGVTESDNGVPEPADGERLEPEPVDVGWNTRCGVDEKQFMIDSNPLGGIWSLR